MYLSITGITHPCSPDFFFLSDLTNPRQSSTFTGSWRESKKETAKGVTIGSRFGYPKETGTHVTITAWWSLFFSFLPSLFIPAACAVYCPSLCFLFPSSSSLWYAYADIFLPFVLIRPLLQLSVFFDWVHLIAAFLISLRYIFNSINFIFWFCHYFVVFSYPAWICDYVCFWSFSIQHHQQSVTSELVFRTRRIHNQSGHSFGHTDEFGYRKDDV